MKETRLRYSDTELEEFRKLIEERLEKERSLLRKMKPTRSLEEKDSHERSSNLFDCAKETHDKEVTTMTISRKEKYIEALEKSLQRIHNKTYGICRRTGKLIPKNRLKASLIVTLCIEQKKTEGHEQRKRQKIMAR